MPMASPLRESLLLVPRPAAGTKSPSPLPGDGLFFQTSTDSCVKDKLGPGLNLASHTPFDFQGTALFSLWEIPHFEKGVWESHAVVRIMHMECLSLRRAPVSLSARCASTSALRKEERVYARLW